MDNSTRSGKELISFIRAHFQTLRRNAFLLSATATLAFALILWLLASLFEHYFFFSPIAKTAWILAISTSTLGFGLYFKRFFFQSFRNYVSDLAQFLNDPRLKSILDLECKNAPSLFDQIALRQLAQQLNPKISDKALEAFEFDQLKTFRNLALSTVLPAVIFLVLGGVPFKDGVFRLANFWVAYEPAIPFSYTVQPGDTLLERGSPFQAEISFQTLLPETVALQVMRASDPVYRSYSMGQTKDRFVSSELLLNENFEYRIKMDGFYTPSYSASVQLRPRFDSLVVNITPPSYTKLPSSRLDYPFASIEAYPGTALHFRMKTNKDIQQLQAISSQGDSLRIAQLGSRLFTAQTRVTSADTLRFSMSDSTGMSNSNSFQNVIRPLEDQFPIVRILNRDPVEEVFDEKQAPVQFYLSDDFIITKAVLKGELRKSYLPDPQNFSFSLPIKTGQEISDLFILDLLTLNTEPQDELHFWIEAADNDVVSGLKWSKSSVYVIRFASTADYLLSLDETEQAINENFEETNLGLEEIEQQLEELKKSFQTDPNEPWKQSDQVENMKRSVDDVEESVKKLENQIEEFSQELKRTDVLSEDTQRMYDDLRRLMQELDDPDLRKALEEMQKGLENFDQNKLREALEKFEFNEDQYKARLERTLDLFKSLQTFTELEKMNRLVEAMEKQEQALDSTNVAPKRFEEGQNEVREQLEQLQKRNESLPKKAPNTLQQPIDSLNQALSEQLRQAQEEIERLKQKMAEQSQSQDERDGQSQKDENGDQRQQNNEQNQPQPLQTQPQDQPTTPSTQQMQQMLQNMKQQISQAMASMQMQRKQINIKAVKDALWSLIEISEVEESIAVRVGSLAPKSAAFSDQAREQNRVNRQFKSVVDSLKNVAKEIPQFSSRILDFQAQVDKQAQRSLNYLTERDKGNASAELRFTLGGINQLATMLADLIDQLSQSNGSGGGSGAMSMQQMIEQMQNMGGQQQQLNQMLQQLLNDVQGNRLSQEQMGRLDQMAKMQNQIRKQLKEMQQNGGLEPGDKTLSELERMAKIMEEAINEMRGGVIDRTMINRQQNILSRMLQAKDALEQRGEEDKREGRDPKKTPTRNPQLDLEGLKKELQRRLNDPAFTKFSEEYQELIQRYFDVLNHRLQSQEEAL